MAIVWEQEQVQDEVTRHLQELIRRNTVNPPGNETQAAEYLLAMAQSAGIDAQILESAPGRGNFVARIPGRGKARPLLLMGHSDVVSVEADKWTHDPFGGEIADGYVWGRGAGDMKDLVACELMVMLLVARQGLQLDGDLIMMTAADEEAGGRFGAGWMWRNHRDLIDAEFAINEGGGLPITVGGQRFYACQTAEKGIARLRLAAHGAPGHASVPLSDTAMLHAGRALAALTEHTLPTVMTRTVESMLRALGAALGPDFAPQLDAMLADPSWENLSHFPGSEAEKRALYATTRNTAVPTIIHGGHRINVIPSEVVIDVDGRILPGQDPERFAADVRTLVGADADVELLHASAGLEADPDSSLFQTIGAVMADLDEGAQVVPYLVSGGTDARHLPDVKVYGFMPLREHPEDFERIHSHDERVAVADLAFGTRALYEIVTRYGNA